MRVGSIALLLCLALAPSAQAAPQRVLYVGDSLGVGTTPLLQRELGSGVQIEGDSRIGRPSPEGLRVLTQRVSPADDIVVFDIGTNDDPANPSLLAGDLRSARQASGDSCMIVATLNRPPLNGVSVDGLNQAVLAFASAAQNVQVVDWNAIVASEPNLLGPDHVHPTPAGYALRAQLFAQTVADCSAPPQASDDLVTPKPAPKARHRKRKPAPKVPGIESSGISFTEPLRVRGQNATLLLPNTKPPYPAVVMLGGTQAAAEFMAAHGIAAVTGSFANPRAVVDAIARRKDVRSVGVWGLGADAQRAAQVAGEDDKVEAVVAISPRIITRADQRGWEAGDAAPVADWLKLRARTDASLTLNPRAAWSLVRQPVLAVWGTRDREGPITANAAELRKTLERSGNRDRSFRWFDAGHTLANAPGFLEETSRWLGLRLGPKRAKAAVSDALPPANGDQDLHGISGASAIYGPQIQIVWLLLPAALLVFALTRPHSRLVWLAAGLALASLAAIGGGIALVLGSDSVAELAGVAWPFALARLLAIAAAVATVLLFRRRAWLAGLACTIWIALGLFWLL